MGWQAPVFVDLYFGNHLNFLYELILRNLIFENFFEYAIFSEVISDTQWISTLPTLKIFWDTSGYPQVTYFNTEIWSNKEICRLDISVNHVVSMEKIDWLNTILYKLEYLAIV